MTSERRDRPGEPEPEHEAALVEHSRTGGRFDRLLGASFSVEDGFTLKHVAVVIAVLSAVALIFGVISLLA